MRGLAATIAPLGLRAQGHEIHALVGVGPYNLAIGRYTRLTVSRGTSGSEPLRQFAVNAA